MRIRGAKAELEEAGLETELMAESTATLRKEISALTNTDGTGGFDIMIDDKNFKSTYDIILGIGKVWQDISDIDQAALLELLAGKRQGNVLAATLTNLDDLQAALQTSQNSAGSAIAEHEIWLDSIEAKTNQFKAAFESLSSTIVSDDFLKTLYDSGTSLLQVTESLIESCGGFGNTLMTLGTIIAVLNFDKTVSLFSSLFASMKTGFGIIPKVTSAFETLQLAWMEGKSAGGGFITTLKGASSALTGTASAATVATAGILAVVAVIAIAAAAYQNYQRKIEEQRQAAEDAANSMKEQNATLDDYKRKIAELREEIDSGNLSEQEAYEKRQQLIEIQQSLIEMFGNEAKSIDLVTGSIEKQIDAIERLSESQWTSYKQENWDAIQRATDMFTNFDPKSLDFWNSDVFGRITIDLPSTNKLWNAINDLELDIVPKDFKDKFTQEVESAIDGLDLPNTLGENFAWDADGRSIYEILEVYQTLYNVVEKLGKEQFGENYQNYVGDVLSSYSSQINSIKGAIAQNEAIFDTYVEGLLNYDQTYSEVWGKVLASQKQYNDAVLSGDDGAAIDALEGMKAAQQAFLDAGWDNESVNLYMSEFFDQWEQSSKQHEFKLELKVKLADNSDALGNIVKDAVMQFEDENGEVDLYSVLNVGTVYENSGRANNRNVTDHTDEEKAYISLKYAADEYGMSVEELMNLLIQLGYVQGVTTNEMGDAISKYGELSNKMEAIASNSEVVSTALSEQASSGAISVETYEALIALGDEYTDTLEWNGRALVLNKDKLDDLTHSLNETTKAEIQEAQASEKQQWLENAAKILKMQNSYESLTDEQKIELSALESENSQLAKNIQQYQLLISQLDYATSGYKAWLDAQSGTDTGVIYDAAQSAYKAIQEGFESGKVNTNAFNGALSFLVPDEIIAQGTAAVEKYIYNIRGLFDDGYAGVEQFWKMASGAELATYSDENGWQFNPSVTVDDLVEGLGLTKDLVLAAIGELEEYGFEFNFIDEDPTAALMAIQKLIDAKTELNSIRDEYGTSSVEYSDALEQVNELSAAIKELPPETLAKLGIEIDPETQELLYNEQTITATIEVYEKNDVQQMIEDYRTKWSEFQEALASGGDITQLESDLDTLRTNLDGLSEQTKTAFNIDSSLFDSGIASISETINDYKLALIELDNLQAMPDVDQQALTDAQTKVDTLKETLEGIPDIESKIEIDFDTLDEELLNDTFTFKPIPIEADTSGFLESILEAEARIAAIEETPIVIDVDTTTANEKIDSLLTKVSEIEDTIVVVDAETETSTTNVNLLKAAIDDIKAKTVKITANTYGQSALNTLKYTIDQLKNKTITITTNYVSKSSGAANAGGNTGAKKTEVALGGEVGQEIVVDSKNGTWRTIGDKGAEFFQINKGDIVFDAKQTQELLSTGRIQTRGHSYLNGTSYLTDGGKPYISEFYSSSISSTNNSSTNNNSSSASSSDSDAWKEEAENWLKYYKHLRAMELITDREYYTAVDGIAKKYYANNEEYIDDHRALLEELYSLSKELAMDQLTDQEHQIELLSRQEGTERKRIAMYKQMQDELHQIAEEARAYGLDENSDYIQELQKQWWGYQDAITGILDTILDRFHDQVDDIQNVYSTLSDAAQEFAESGFITVDTFQSIISLGAEYLAYLVDENGQLVINEENVRKVIAAKTEQLAVETALNYVQNLRAAVDEGNTLALNNLLYATDAVTNSTWDLVYAQLAMLDLNDDQYRAALDRINTIRSLSDSAISSIGQMTGELTEGLNKQLESLESLLDYVISMIKQEVNNQIDGLKEQVTQYKNIVNLQKESLALAKERDKYERSVADKVKEIADKQAKIIQLSLDDSREAQAEKKRLEEEVAKLQTDLADYQADYAYDATVDSLDKMADAYEEEKEQEIKVLENTISSYQKLYDLAIDRISNGWDSLYQDLIDWNYEYGNVTSTEITSAWDTASLAVQRYGSYLDAVLATQNQIAAAASAGSVGGSTVVGNTGDYDTSGSATLSQISDIVAQMKANSAKWGSASDAERKRLEAAQEPLASQLSALLGRPVVKDYAAGVWYLDRIGGDKLYDKYHSGGIVGRSPTIKENERFALLEDGEGVLTEQQLSGLYKIIDQKDAMLESIKSLYSGSSMPPIAHQVFSSNHDMGAVTNNDNSQLSLAPQINVTVQSNGKFDNIETERIGKRIGSIAMETLSDAFTRKGISTLKGAKLNP